MPFFDKLYEKTLISANARIEELLLQVENLNIYSIKTHTMMCKYIDKLKKENLLLRQANKDLVDENCEAQEEISRLKEENDKPQKNQKFDWNQLFYSETEETFRKQISYLEETLSHDRDERDKLQARIDEMEVEAECSTEAIVQLIEAITGEKLGSGETVIGPFEV